jgi:protocatechuate 3,4-dioxygenase beta subunit
MDISSRRDFLKRGVILGAGGTGLLLAASAQPTEASGDLGHYADYLRQGLQGQGQGPAAGPVPVQGQAQPANWNLTETNILGPYHRAGAPFRAKITPPLEPGTVLLISGRVWAQDTRQPLANCLIDVWQANAQGRYDNDDPANPPAATLFRNRARLVTDENGYYEYETIHPGAYQIGPNAWRPPHIHYWVRHAGYRSLVTQLYFQGDPHQQADQFIRQSLIIPLAMQQLPGNRQYKRGTFNIILARQQ